MEVNNKCFSKLINIKMLFLAYIWKIMASYVISTYKSKNIKVYIPVCQPEYSLFNSENVYNHIHSDYDYTECNKLKWILLYSNTLTHSTPTPTPIPIPIPKQIDGIQKDKYDTYIRNVFLGGL